MNFTILPIKEFRFTTELQIEEALKLISDNCHESESLGMQITHKKFIGIVKKSSFKIISSNFPIGVFSVIHGEISNENSKTIVHLTAKIQNAFIILFSIWLLLPIYGLTSMILKNGFIKTIPLITIVVSMLFLIRYFVVKRLFEKVVSIVVSHLRHLLNLNSN